MAFAYCQNLPRVYTSVRRSQLAMLLNVVEKLSFLGKLSEMATYAGTCDQGVNLHMSI